MKDLRVYGNIKRQCQMFILALASFGAWRLQAASSVPLPSFTTSEEIDGSLEEVTFLSKESVDSDKKIERKGQLAFYPDAEANVVICHGFMCNKHDVAFLRRLFPRGKYNILTFDFRGHGDNRDGQACTFGRDEVFDVEAAVAYLKNDPKIKHLPCIAYGFSMGAASAIESQARNHALFDAMILDCPFDSSENVIKRGLDDLKISAFGYEFGLPGRSLLQKYAFHPHVQTFVKNILRCITALNPRDIEINMCRVYPGESVKKITVPCFFIHCKNDEKIGVESVKNIYNNAACQYKKLWITNGRSHFDSYFYAPERYTSEVRQFLSAVLDGSAIKEEKKELIEDREDKK